jgi:hypothetical protein
MCEQGNNQRHPNEFMRRERTTNNISFNVASTCVPKREGYPQVLYYMGDKLCSLLKLCFFFFFFGGGGGGCKLNLRNKASIKVYNIEI